MVWYIDSRNRGYGISPTIGGQGISPSVRWYGISPTNGGCGISHPFGWRGIWSEFCLQTCFQNADYAIVGQTKQTDKRGRIIIMTLKYGIDVIERHAELLTDCLDNYNDTPEKFGELLYEATMPIWSPLDWQRQRIAVCIISELPHGKELIQAEKALFNR